MHGLDSQHSGISWPDCQCDLEIGRLEPSVWVACGVSPCEEASCAQALADMAAWLPLPVAREHIQAPLLQSLSGRPDVALALIGVACALGGDYAAAHLVPQLLAILCSRTLSSAGMLLLAGSTAPCPSPASISTASCILQGLICLRGNQVVLQECRGCSQLHLREVHVS